MAIKRAVAVAMISVLPLVLSGCGDHGGSGSTAPEEGSAGGAPSSDAPAARTQVPATLPSLPPQQPGSGATPAPTSPQAQPGSSPANNP